MTCARPDLTYAVHWALGVKNQESVGEFQVPSVIESPTHAALRTSHKIVLTYQDQSPVVFDFGRSCTNLGLSSSYLNKSLNALRSQNEQFHSFNRA